MQSRCNIFFSEYSEKYIEQNKMELLLYCMSTVYLKRNMQTKYK